MFHAGLATKVRVFVCFTFHHYYNHPHHLIAPLPPPKKKERTK